MVRMAKIRFMGKWGIVSKRVFCHAELVEALRRPSTPLSMTPPRFDKLSVTSVSFYHVNLNSETPYRGRFVFS